MPPVRQQAQRNAEGGQNQAVQKDLDGLLNDLGGILKGKRVYVPFLLFGQLGNVLKIGQDLPFVGKLKPKHPNQQQGV